MDNTANQRMDGPKDGHTNEQMDQWTDIASYRIAYLQLKKWNEKNEKPHSLKEGAEQSWQCLKKEDLLRLKCYHCSLTKNVLNPKILPLWTNITWCVGG